MDDLNASSTPETGTSATATLPDTGSGTAALNGDANNNGQGAPVQEEGFTRVDPKTLPPQLRQHYDNMLRDYKDKTTKLSETTKSEVQKAVESYRQRAEFYDQISGQESFVNKWNEYVKEQERVAQNNGQEVSDPIAQMKEQLQQMTQKIQLSEITQITDAFAEAVNDKGEKIHPEFDNLNNISIGKIQNGNQADDFSLLRACIELSPSQNPNERLANGYKMAKAVYDGIFESGKKAGMGRLQSKVLNGSIPPSNSTGDVMSVTDKKPKNAHEAMQMAKRGQMVSRD